MTPDTPAPGTGSPAGPCRIDMPGVPFGARSVGTVDVTQRAGAGVLEWSPS